jgi:Ca2+-binding RTX toxin-like protein
MDSVRGTVANDKIYGDARNNTLNGDKGDDYINGREGNDTLEGGLGTDYLFGAVGNDKASYANAGTSVVANLTTSTASGGDGVDGFASIESLRGGPGNDTLTGDAAANIIDGAQGNDTIDGQGGADWAIYDSATTPVNADLAAGTATSQSTGTDSLTRIENLRGGSSNDQLLGDDAANNLVAGAGATDFLDGRGGDDVFSSYPLTPYVYATISYESAPGAVDVNLETRTATGAAGNDTFGFVPSSIFGSNFSDRIACDAMTTSQGCDVSAGGGNDTITGTNADDVMAGGPGDDRMDAKAGVDVANYDFGVPVNVNLTTGRATGQGTDTLSGFNQVVGSSGNDTIVGPGGFNCLIWAEGGDDKVSTSVGADGDGCTLVAGDGNDTITGSGGTDVIYPDNNGAAGNDTVHAGAGDDTVVGDLGNDNLDGGPGTDLLTYADGTTSPLNADLSAGIVTGLGTDSVAGFEDFTGGFGNDKIIGTDGPNHIDGGAGNDTIFGRGSSDLLTAGEGNDWMDGNAGDDVMIPGRGDDTMYGEGGTDRMAFAPSQAPVVVNMASGSATGDGFDHMNGVENMTGTSFDDVLTGDANPNVIDGLGGSDTCNGGGGADTLVNCP